MSQADSDKNQNDLKLHFLVLRCQVGDERAFRDLYTQFREKTGRYLHSIINETVAEDLNQEVWLTVYNRIGTLYNVNGFRTWLFQMTRNRALDYFRSSKRLAEFQDVLESELTIDQPEIDTVFFEKEDYSYLKASIQKLAFKHREVLELNFFEGMDYEEISLIIGCSVGTVKSRIHNAKSKLKNLLNTKYQDNE